MADAGLQLSPGTTLPGGDKARFVRTMFDSIAARYDLMNRLMTGAQDERWRETAADAVFPETVQRAIDIGAGTGDLSLALARRAPAAHVLALDFSEGMLRRGDAKRRQTSGGRRVQPVLGDGMQLPVPDGSVDAIVTAFTLRNVNDVSTVFRECARALRPGGRLAVLELTPVEHPLVGPLFRFYFHRLVPLIGAAVSGQGYAYHYLPESVTRFPTASRLRDLMLAAGFSQVTYRKLAMGTVALHVGETAAPVGTSRRQVSQSLHVEEVHRQEEWDGLAAALPNSHGMQSWAWGELRRETGWVTRRLAFQRGGQTVAAAAVQRRALPGTPWGVSYCPKGPALNYGGSELLGEVLTWLKEDTRRQRSIFLSVEPEAEANQRDVAAAIRAAGYAPSANQLQANATVLVDVTADDEALLKMMSSTWRRYIRKAERDGVRVRAGSEADLDQFYALYQETGERDQFVVRPAHYMRSLWRHLAPSGLVELFLAELDGKAVAALMPLRFGSRAWYLYGASSGAGQKSHAPYLLQWHTMRWARDHGCATYDMWGAPDDPGDPDYPLAGVYYFKRGFGGRHVRWVGAYDVVAFPALYWGWQRAMPRAFAALRRLRGERGAAVHSRALGG